MADDDSLPRGRITDESVVPMRQRIGFPNPTLRTGAVDEPGNIAATDDAIRRFALGIGDDNPLYCRSIMRETPAGSPWR
jgi:hypothetical protein